MQFMRERVGFVALSWIIISAIGALAFCVFKAAPHICGCLFETVSGFTTTGSSVFKNPEEVNKALLLWRSITQWIGGMGVLVFIMAVTPLVEKLNSHNESRGTRSKVRKTCAVNAHKLGNKLYDLYCSHRDTYCAFACGRNEFL